MALLQHSDELEQMFNEQTLARRRLGVVVGGSLSKGLVVKLDSGISLEQLAVGRYVVVHGEGNRFFCMITDIALDNTNPEIQSAPPDISDRFLRAVYVGTMAYGKIHIQPMLMIGSDGKALPVKTIPGHFMNVMNATVQDVNDVFGKPDDHHFNIGAPLELPDAPLHVNLQRVVERSVGVFGKSGTGKSFYTRMLLAGIIAKQKAVSLVFDMHNDYGYSVKSEGRANARGLKQLFPNNVTVCSLDPEMSIKRGVAPDFVVQIAYSAVEPEDLAMLRETMNFSDAMIDAAYALSKMWKGNWISRLLKANYEDLEEIEAKTPNRVGTIQALKRRLERFERWGFLVEDTPPTDSVQEIMHLLADKDQTVVLEFGRYGNSLEAYILVANYLTRRIHARYVDAMERAFATGEKQDEPRNLMIVIEEAHKFLDPRIAQQTIFGIIARELRKYNVTLLVVDQRPSGIDEEVMSQIGTRVTALLDNERDIAAVLTGISGAQNLREVLARLDTKQQAIIMGHAVPMPVVIKTRDYDDTFYHQIMQETVGGPKVSARPNLGLSSNGRGGRR